jgi:hypothetical protein
MRTTRRSFIARGVCGAAGTCILGGGWWAGVAAAASDQAIVTVKPQEYPRALGNPLSVVSNEIRTLNMKNVTKTSIASCTLVIALSFMLKAAGQPAELLPGMHSDLVEVVPAPYAKALRNPLKGFTTRGIHDHEWATLAHTYIKWNELENHESDGNDKIRRVTDKMWGDIASRNIKVIPRVYLHWSGNQKFWPADMKPDDYTHPE